MPKLTIDNQDIEVPAGTSILQAAETLGIEIPRFCYHDRLSVPANCRMCLVEVQGGPPKPVASCAMACGDNMVVKTDSEMVKKARKGVMEMLLINHPLDCPICDQGGECDLQDQAVAYGFDRSRFYENKRAVPDKELGPLIKTSMNRCINCTRCVRFAEEVAGTPVLGQLNRGEDAEISTFIGELVRTELSGNLIDVCPVGALLSKPYNFKARPWELRKTETIDVHDALGCNIRVDARGREVMRVLPRLHEGINEEWINDRTRFAYDGLNYKRLDRPYIRDEKTGKLREVEWAQAFAYTARRLQGVKGQEMAGLVGDLPDLESIVALGDLLDRFESPHRDCRTDGSVFDTSAAFGYLFNSTIAGIDQADAILLIGTNPRWEGTLVNARILRNVNERRIKVGVIGPQVDLTYPYAHLGSGPKDIEKFSKSKDGFAERFRNAKNPMIIVGTGAFQRENGLAVHALLSDLCRAFNVVREDWNGFNVLHGAASRVGALSVGFTPGQGGRDFRAILEGTRDGNIKALYLLGADEFDARAAIGWQTFVIYQGHHGDAGAARADVIFPGAAYTEKDGIYVNTEGRPQLAKRASFPLGHAREDWKILRALSEVLGRTLPYNTEVELRQRITAQWPHLTDFDVPMEAAPSDFGVKGPVEAAPFVLPVKDFYNTNVICRASKTMKACAQAFAVPARSEMMEAAE
ncbi:MAG: NADH-quinone oxidoreductase subunit NuoG [Alphaproteobacteria bacterium]|nr:NADH-quinone oxidoreductase subunit NuoG [Alphaproteobacteria bacterium]